MRYKSFLILFLVFFAATPGAAAAENSRYRVELIVLTHLGHDEQPREALQLEDYSAALDFLTPPAETETPSASLGATPTEALQAADTGTGEPEESSAMPDAETDPWNVVSHVPELGERMQDAWRRLRLSEPFRPLQYLAWEQGGNAPFPTVRVHDLEVILSVEPAAAGLTTAEPQELAPAPDQDPAHSATVVPADVAEALPIRHYRLDGAASLTRSRFLHLSIAVELREPLYEGTAAAGAGPRAIDSRDVSPDASLGGVPDAPEQPAPTGFLVHELVQSRVVRTGRMEYFDGPVLGVLAWVTDISETVAERPLE
jgi:hypothetical protein